MNQLLVLKGPGCGCEELAGKYTLCLVYKRLIHLGCPQDAMDETFLLTNIAPQVGDGFNRHCECHPATLYTCPLIDCPLRLGIPGGLVQTPDVVIR